MEPLISRPLAVEWAAPPEEVAASIRQAIDEGRYEDAGHPEWALWRVWGSVEGSLVKLRLDTHSRPGSLHAYQFGIDLSGELAPWGSGTRLEARASMLNGRWERPLALGLGSMFALQGPLLVGGLGGVLLGLALAAAFLVLFWGLLLLLGRGAFGALPQVEAVLGRIGAPSKT